jgi:hypothetical protein
MNQTEHRIPDMVRRIEVERRVQHYMREVVVKQYGGIPPWSGPESEELRVRETRMRAAFAYEAYKQEVEPIYRAMIDVMATCLPVYVLDVATRKIIHRGTVYPPELRKQLEVSLDHIERIAGLYGLPFTRPDLDHPL